MEFGKSWATISAVADEGNLAQTLLTDDESETHDGAAE